MKKSILVIVVVLFFSSPVFAGGYIGGNFGLAMPNDSGWTDSTLPGVTLEVTIVS